MLIKSRSISHITIKPYIKLANFEGNRIMMSQLLGISGFKVTPLTCLPHKSISVLGKKIPSQLMDNYEVECESEIQFINPEFINLTFLDQNQ